MYELVFVGLYLPAVLLIGLSGARRGGRDLDQYFLGGRALPWWALGLSFGASTVDLGGMMAATVMFATLGLRWFPIEMRGVSAVAFTFFALFVARWHRRSGAMTLADWMLARFGEGPGGRAARLVMASLILMLVVSMLSSFVEGFGRLAAPFLSWEIRGSSGELLVSASTVIAIVLVVVSLLQVTLSGLRGAVYTGVLQWGLFAFAALSVSLAAFTSELNAAHLHQAWAALGQGGQTLEHWRMLYSDQALPLRSGEVKPGGLWSLGLFWVALIAIEGVGGPLLPYVNQRFLAARSDREASWMTALAVVTGLVRWPFIVGVALLALGLGAAIPTDPQAMLGSGLASALSPALRVAVVVSLLGVAMAVVTSTLNAGAAYLVHDLYRGFFCPEASERRLIWLAKLSTVALGLVGLGLTFLSDSPEQVLRWITFGGLFGGVALPLALRWYWERLNGWGWALGTVSGVWTAVALGLQWPELGELPSFVTAGLVSLFVAVFASLRTAETPVEVLASFYGRTGPMGWWPRAQAAISPQRVAEIRAENRLARLSILPAIALFFSLSLAPIYLVMGQWLLFALASLGAAISALILYFTWFRPLRWAGPRVR